MLIIGFLVTRDILAVYQIFLVLCQKYYNRQQFLIH